MGDSVGRPKDTSATGTTFLATSGNQDASRANGRAGNGLLALSHGSCQTFASSESRAVEISLLAMPCSGLPLPFCIDTGPLGAILSATHGNHERYPESILPLLRCGHQTPPNLAKP